MNLDFGKRITHESFQKGDRTIIKVEYSIPVMIANKAEALSELMRCLELLNSGDTNQLTIVIKADPMTHDIRQIRKNYILEEE